VSDIGPNSNRRQVARAVSTLQDQLGAFEGGELDTRITAAQDAVDALELNEKIVAGPQTLAESQFLTKPILRKVLTVAAGPNASTVDVAHGVTFVAAGRILEVVVTLSNGTNRLCFGQGGMLADTIAHSIIVAIDGTNVSLTSGAGGDFSLYAGSIILVYTNS
jgi:hypothetical protein